MESNCSNCSLRAKYDRNPHSLMGKFWRWHIRFCPGWKRYVSSLSPEQQESIMKRYDVKVK